MTEKLAYDSLPFHRKSVRTIDDNGFLHVAVSPVTREQVAPYRGCEIPHSQELGFDDDVIYYGYRPASELSKSETIQSLNGIPIQFEHHIDYAANPAKDTRVGSTGTDAKWDAPYLTNSLHIQDKTAIDRIIDGSMKELSLSYRYKPVKKHGTFKGQDYDFVMTNISCNHLALVEEGRAGRDVCVCDAQIKLKEGEKMSDPIEKAEVGLAQAIVDLHKSDTEGNTTDVAPEEEKKEVQMDSEDKVARLLDALKADGIDVSKYEGILKNEAQDDIPEDVPPVDEKKEEASPAPAPASETTPSPEPAPEKSEDAPVAEDDGDLDAEEGKTAEDEDLSDDPKDQEPAPLAKDDNHEVKHNQALDALKNCGLESATDEIKNTFFKAYSIAQDHALDLKAVRNSVMKQFQQHYKAASECAPIIGRVEPMAYDSAGSIYRAALKQMGVAGAMQMKPNEARSVYRALRAQSATSMANDSALQNDDRSSDAVFSVLNNVKLGV